MDKIAVLDFGGQYAHLIASRVRRLGVYSEVKRSRIPAYYLKDYKGIILSGGPKSVFEEKSPRCDRRLFNLGIPVLGICYGHHMMAFLLGGYVTTSKVKEFGPADAKFNDSSLIFRDIEPKQSVWMSHGDSVTRLPIGFNVIASTSDCPNAAIANIERNFFGLQFHPEVTHTKSGTQIFTNFLDICGCKRDWDLQDFLKRKIDYIKRYVRNRNVFLLVSGGVDSTVSYAILEKALGHDRVYGLFIDTGFMRMNEAKEVVTALKSIGINNLHVYDASQEFYTSLKGVYDPEIKRTIIGNLFLDIKEKVSRSLNLNIDQWMLGQGTIYPDTIESGGTVHSSRIKTHHNRVEGIQELMRRKRVIEPVRELYKDEVRTLGESLGLPKNLIWRHPFPGPGLAIRTLAVQKEEYPKNHLALERQVNMLLGETEFLKGNIIPLKSVGVQGDNRTYQHPLIIYGDTTWDELKSISTRLTNNFKEINRVIYAFGVHEIHDIKIQLTDITPERVEFLRKADKIAHDVIFRKELYNDIWQFPVVLLPLRLNKHGNECIVLRPVQSVDAMTANFYEMDWMTVKELADELHLLPGLSAVLYDATNKPPGTIEWE